MADIQIERKERNLWPWVIGALVAVALLFWFVSPRGSEIVSEGRETIESTAGGVLGSAPATGTGTRDDSPGAVNEYLTFVEQSRTRAAADSSHDYTADGIKRLAAALEAVIERDTVGARALESQVTWLQNRADAVQRDWRSTKHAESTRAAFTGAATLIKALHEQRFSTSETGADEVVEAAQRVRPDVPLLQQTAQVQQFFDRAADAVRVMASADS